MPIDATALYGNFSPGDIGIFTLASTGFTSRSWAHIVVSFFIMFSFFILTVIIESCFLIDLKPSSSLQLSIEISGVEKIFDKDFIKTEIERELGTTVSEVEQIYNLYALRKLCVKREKLKNSQSEKVQEEYDKLTEKINELKEKDLSTGIYYVQFNNLDDRIKFNSCKPESFSKYKIRDAIHPSDIIEKNIGVSLCSKVARVIVSYVISILLFAIICALTSTVYLALMQLTFLGGLISINILQVLQLNVDQLYEFLPIIYVLVYNSPYIFTALNDVIELIFIALTEFECHYSMDNQNMSLILKLVLFNFASTTVVPVSLFVYLIITLHNKVVGNVYIPYNYFLSYNLLCKNL